MKTQPIIIRRGLSLYKQPLRSSGGSRFWYARVYMNVDGRKLHVQSTRTTDPQLAQRKAEDFWADLVLKRRLIESGQMPPTAANPEPYRFDRLVDTWLDGLEQDAGSNPRRVRAWKDAKKLCFAANGFCAFFKRMDVREITTERMREYLRFAAEHSKKGDLASTTKRNHMSSLRSILKLAHEKSLITSVPTAPKIRIIDQPRSWLKPADYRSLWRYAAITARYAKRYGELKKAEEMRELADFVIFMVNTFLRPSEWKDLRQKHIKVVRGENPHLELAVIDGKVKPRTAVSMPGAVTVYDRILKRHGHDPERHLFKPQYSNRTTAFERMRDALETLFVECDLAVDEFGRKRTMYCLRHTALMLRFLNGDNVDHLLLARNAGTSVEQLERFYLSHAEPSMKIANLQSFKDRPPVPAEEEELEEPLSDPQNLNLWTGLEEPSVAGRTA